MSISSFNNKVFIFKLDNLIIKLQHFAIIINKDNINYVNNFVKPLLINIFNNYQSLDYIIFYKTSINFVFNYAIDDKFANNFNEYIKYLLLNEINEEINEKNEKILSIYIDNYKDINLDRGSLIKISIENLIFNKYGKIIKEHGGLVTVKNVNIEQQIISLKFFGACSKCVFKMSLLENIANLIKNDMKLNYTIKLD